MRSEIVGTGIPFAEGPVWCPDGTVVATSVAAGALYRVHPETGATEKIADTGGGANGATLCRQGLLVTQNGGIDFSKLPIGIDLPRSEPVTPGIQLVRDGDGTVTYLADTGLLGPNDLAMHGDDVYFTDPGHFPPPPGNVGRVMVLHPGGTLETFAGGFSYCNGIAFDLDGNVVVVEQRGLQRVFPDGSREWVIETLGNGGGDGFCLDADGKFYVASTIEHGIRVVDSDGKVLDFLPIEGKGVTTNCCFGGPDMRTLFVTDAIPGNLVAFEGMPTRGLEIPVGSVQSA